MWRGARALLDRRAGDRLGIARTQRHRHAVPACRRSAPCWSASGATPSPAISAINTGLTLYRALVGFVIAAVGGVLLGMAMSRNAVAHWFFDPIVSVGFPMPKIAFLPVVILWLGVYDVSKITMIVFDAIFPVITATVIAIQGVERELIWSARNMGAGERELLWQIILPAALPQIMTGLAGGAAALADRRDRDRNADGRLWPRRRHDDRLALCQFHEACLPASSRSPSLATLWSRR